MSRNYKKSLKKLPHLKSRTLYSPQTLLELLQKNQRFVYHRAICDDCDSSISGVRYKCLNCENFDICVSCERDHYLRFKPKKNCNHNPLTHTFLKCYFAIKSRKESSINLFFPKPFAINEKKSVEDLKADVFNEFIVCDDCETVVRGRRYSCLHCEYDLCESCEAKIKVHHREHILMKSPFGLEIDNLPRIKENIYKYPDVLVSHITGEEGLLKSQKLEKAENEEEVEETKSKKKQLASEDYKLRKMNFDDLDRIVEIENSSFSFPYSYECFFHIVLKSTQSKPIFPLVLEIENRIAGYVIFERKIKWVPFSYSKYVPLDDSIVFYASIISLAVSPSHRRMGVAKALTKELIIGSKKLKCKYVSLNVSVKNIPAQKLYAKFGFQVVEWCLEYYNFRDESENEASNINDEKEANSKNEAKLGDCRGDALKMKLYFDKDFEKIEREKGKRKKHREKLHSNYHND